MEKIEIKLKECSLTCENYYPDGIGIGSYCSIGQEKREISCLHMPVCYKYTGRKPTAIDVIRCGECRRWHPDGTYGIDIDGEKQQSGTCDFTSTACKENHFCSFGRRNM